MTRITIYLELKNNLKRKYLTRYVKSYNTYLYNTVTYFFQTF